MQPQGTTRKGFFDRLYPVTQALLLRIYGDIENYAANPNPDYGGLERACISYNFAIDNWKLAKGVCIVLEKETGKSYTKYSSDTLPLIAARDALEDAICSITGEIPYSTS